MIFSVDPHPIELVPSQEVEETPERSLPCESRMGRRLSQTQGERSHQDPPCWAVVKKYPESDGGGGGWWCGAVMRWRPLLGEG